MANIIEYNSYIGSIEYSSKNRCFLGKLEMINDLVTFEATNIDDLEKNFKNAVDEYLQTCKELNKTPQKTYKGVFNVRISPDLHKKVYKEAIKMGVSLNTFVKQALSNEIDRELCK